MSFLARLPRVTINIKGRPYLTRYYLLGEPPEGEHEADRRLSVYLHHFHDSDQRRQLHNHPWKWSFSLILKGGYSEERLFRADGIIQRFRLEPGDFNWLSTRDFHRADLLDPERGSWSLFVAGPRVQEWGFLDRETREFADWRTNPEAIP